MAKKKIIGTCPMCTRTNQEIRVSHYVGRAIHRRCQVNGKGQILMTPQHVVASERQLKAHLLCTDCEKRLNKYGDTPVFQLIDNRTSFPLRDKMNSGLAIGFPPMVGALRFSGISMAVNTDALAYYALSFLWKGSVHRWPTVNGQTTGVDLGEYQEPTRQFLMGEAPFPKGISVIVTASEDYLSRGMAYVPHVVKHPTEKQLSVLVHGVWFDVIFSDKDEWKEICCVQSPLKVLHLRNNEDRMMLAGQRIQRTAKVQPELAERTPIITRP
ncbi:MAG: hypothetical protein ACLP3K_08855 [Candidatus Acidiferrales bacterium]